MKNINKITTLILLVLWLLLIWKAFFISPPKEIVLPLEPYEESASASKEPAEQPADIKIYATLLERLKAPFNISRYKDLFTRNIFVKPEKPIVVLSPESLTLLSVEPIILPFMYNGYIQIADGTIIGQVNWGDKTHFVQKGEKFKDYRVIEITKKTLTVDGKEGKLVLEYKKPVKGKELRARLYNELDEKTYEVSKGDEISSYKILDITPDSVVIWGEKKEWIIKKGR